jgi:hypothetical protein
VKLFAGQNNPEAIGHAAAGGQSLEQWPAWVTRLIPTAPRCFRGRPFAKLYDQDADRLRATARRLGVRVVKIDRPGRPEQHVDLVGGPMRKALAECDE